MTYKVFVFFILVVCNSMAVAKVKCEFGNTDEKRAIFLHIDNGTEEKFASIKVHLQFQNFANFANALKMAIKAEACLPQKPLRTCRFKLEATKGYQFTIGKTHRFYFSNFADVAAAVRLFTETKVCKIEKLDRFCTLTGYDQIEFCYSVPGEVGSTCPYGSSYFSLPNNSGLVRMSSLQALQALRDLTEAKFCKVD